MEKSLSNRCYRCQVPKILQNLPLLLTRSFCPFEPTARASFVRPAFASSLINAVLAFSNFSTMFSVVHVYLSTYTKTAWLLEQH